MTSTDVLISPSLGVNDSDNNADVSKINPAPKGGIIRAYWPLNVENQIESIEAYQKIRI